MSVQIGCITRQAGRLFSVSTVKAGPRGTEQRVRGLEWLAGVKEIDEYVLGDRLFVGNETALYRAQNKGGSEVLVKLYSPEVTQTLDEQARKKLPLLRSEYLPRIFRTGVWNGCAYECMEELEGIPLSEVAPVQEELISEYILPQLLEALQKIHKFDIFHNDIKPSNLLWDERTHRVFLIDFESIARAGHLCAGLTVPFSAPETIVSKGKCHSEKSDCCALGLTLYYLLTGSLYLPCDDIAGAQMFWQKELVLPEQIRTEYRILLIGLLNMDAQKRYGLNEVFRWLRRMGHPTQIPKQAKKEPVAKQQNTSIHPLKVKDHMLYSVDELILETSNDWQYMTFLLREHQLDRFLAQFGKEVYQKAQICARMYDAEQGLFCLIQMLHPSEQIIWLGRRYDNLSELVAVGQFGADSTAEPPIVSFCRLGLLEFYYQNNGASEEQLTEARRLQQLMRSKPRVAVQELHVALSDCPYFEVSGNRIETLEDLAELLTYADEALDWLVKTLMGSDAFSAWLAYQPFGDIKDRVRAQLGGRSL